MYTLVIFATNQEIMININLQNYL